VRSEKVRQALVVASALVALSGPKLAHATLGGDLSSIVDNEQQLGAVRRVRPLAIGERHELSLPSGTVIHEYVSSSGAVYAVTWRGPRMPNLHELLGLYFAELGRRDIRTSFGHHRLNITSPDLIVRSSGHQRWFEGHAWLPSLVPTGVSADALE
jgi:hypothetical protein